MAEVKVGLRYNNDADEVELTVDGEVALTSGKDVFESWVRAYNDKYKPAEPVPVVEATVAEEVKPEAPVEPKEVDPAEPVQEPEPEKVEEVVVDKE